MKHSLRSRIRITKRGKFLRRPMGVGHCKAKQNFKTKQRKRKMLQFEKVDLRSIKKQL